MKERQVLSIDKPSFARRWLSDFLLDRHALAARLLLLILSFAFFLWGPVLILWLASYLPVAELGSSGASLYSHHLLQFLAAMLGGAIFLLSLRPALVSIEMTPENIRLIWRLWFFSFSGVSLPWESIGTICIERPRGKTNMETYKLCLYSCQDKNKSIKIPLANLANEDNREKLAGALQDRARQATIEPGALEAIKPAGNLSFTDIWLSALAAAPGRERLTPLPDGTTLKDRFTIKKRLGGGGQATAYLAGDMQQLCPVVLKETILPVYADLHTRKQALEKFHAEALALASVKSPQIVKYLDSFVEDQRAYLVLQYIEGRTLRQEIQSKGALTGAEAVKAGRQMCAILSTLHSLNPPLIHRDFTPDNIMINADGKLVLIDFAVAVSTQESCQDAAGKVAYMAPEQFKGSSTVQNDIYSCGASLHYILTGKDPVALSECRPGSVNASIDSRLDEIVARATNQLTEARYKNIQELESALKELSA